MLFRPLGDGYSLLCSQKKLPQHNAALFVMNEVHLKAPISEIIKPNFRILYGNIFVPISIFRVSDPHCFNADPDPAFFLIADPDSIS